KDPVVRQRLEKQVTSYDNQGNVLTRLEPNQVLETNVWYSAEEHRRSLVFSLASSQHKAAQRTALGLNQASSG
ncbi:hypothetical protein OO306_21800, partial [Pseudomonas sp. DCB_AW]|uniref:hypothetical protein n=1 Tax=Pseudomonas sp. DCB_AW TaxID=2993596 RepID=UPI002248F859